MKEAPAKSFYVHVPGVGVEDYLSSHGTTDIRANRFDPLLLEDYFGCPNVLLSNARMIRVYYAASPEKLHFKVGTTRAMAGKLLEHPFHGAVDISETFGTPLAAPLPLGTTGKQGVTDTTQT